MGGDPSARDSVYGRYAGALAKEIAARGTEISDTVNTLYIGGGTPSVLPLSFFSSLLDALGAAGHGGAFDEFTVEVNPDDIVEKGWEYVEGLLRLGVNRVSMGVQSFDDRMLRWMNRRHDAESARKAYSILENAGVENISIDLIFGISSLTDQDWSDTLAKALAISPRGVLPKHLSCYQLSVEPGSALASLVEKGRYEEASDEMCMNQYAMLCEAMASAGYHHYEISNFALPGYEALHNSAYWRHVPYLGLGPGAHSLVCSPVAAGLHGGMSAVNDDVLGKVMMRRWNNPDLKAYLDAAGAGDFSLAGGCEILTGDQIMTEKIMLALRTSEGIDSEYLERHCPAKALERALMVGNLIKTPAGKICIPEDHYFVSDGIVSDIL